MLKIIRKFDALISKYKMLKSESEVKKLTDVKTAKLHHLKNEDKKLVISKKLLRQRQQIFLRNLLLGPTVFILSMLFLYRPHYVPNIPC